jgi:hypothetical protein
MERLIFSRSIEVRDAGLVQVAAMGRRETGSLHKTIGDPASRVLLVSSFSYAASRAAAMARAYVS